MLDLFSGDRKRKEVPELNVVPILDMLMSVIFFLLLTTTFLQFTKESVPPASVSTITDPIKPPPVAAKLMVFPDDKGLKLSLNWSGIHPGKIEKDFTPSPENPDASEAELLKSTTDMATEFNAQYPNEKTIQIGFGEDVPYQHLITVMDGVKEKLPDMVLFSYKEVAARKNR